MNDKVFLVVSGRYSDYRVDCAFTNEDIATQYAAAMNNITVVEQEALHTAMAVGWPKADKLLKSYPPTVRDVYTNDGARVEPCDLYTELPIVPRADA